MSTTVAAAHPHVFAGVRTTLVFATDGSLTSIGHEWTFDDLYSTYLTQGIESKIPGTYTRDELAPIAAQSIGALKQSSYFTFVKGDGKSIEFNESLNRYFEYDSKGGVLTLHFTLPIKQPLPFRSLTIAIYDPSYFNGLGFVDGRAVSAISLPTGCRISTIRPKALQQIPDTLVASMNASNLGAQFANEISVNCR
jgi:ABC-type uncharacterized transport system substrate-binding protein